jgi:CheY-like chemotaxis protein
MTANQAVFDEFMGVACVNPVRPFSAASAGGSGAARPLRILLAEDTPANQFLMIRILEGRGHQVQVAENGAEAVRMFAEQNFDLVLLDLHMPVMDGFQAAAEIRALEKDSEFHVPIVAVTAYASLESRARCIGVGMDTFVAKPIDIHEFVRLVESFPPRDEDHRPLP